MPIQLTRTTSADPHFTALVKQLDAYLAEMDGAEHSFYAQYNKVDLIKHVVVCYQNEEAIACGAMKELSPSTMEVKRMYTSPAGRNKGIATQILGELERWAQELGYEKCVLETGKRQQEAVSLYQKCGYQLIPNYGQYIGVTNSVCFEKDLQ